MKSPLHRLYAAKLALLATLTTVVGVGLLVLVHLFVGQPGWQWLSVLPLTEIGSTLFATGLVVIAFEYIDGEDADARATQRLRAVLREEASAIRDAVIDGFAFQPDDLARVSSTRTLDQITRNALAIQLGDGDMASAAYGDLRSQVLRSPERWHDLDIDISLIPYLDQAKQARQDHDPLFLATLRCRYKVRPAEAVRRFTCVSDIDEYRELLQDPTTEPWFFQPVAGYTGASPEAFRLIEFTIDGVAQKVRRTQRRHAQTYTVTFASAAPSAAEPAGALMEPTTDQQLAEETMPEVVVSYTYCVLVQQRGHLLYFDITRPCKGIKISFRYGDCGISYVNVLDFIANSAQARISRSADAVPDPTIEVSHDGWVFPKSGVAFVWAMTDDAQAHRTSTATHGNHAPRTVA